MYWSLPRSSTMAQRLLDIYSSPHGKRFCFKIIYRTIPNQTVARISTLLQTRHSRLQREAVPTDHPPISLWGGPLESCVASVASAPQNTSSILSHPKYRSRTSHLLIFGNSRARLVSCLLRTPDFPWTRFLRSGSCLLYSMVKCVEREGFAVCCRRSGWREVTCGGDRSC